MTQARPITLGDVVTRLRFAEQGIRELAVGTSLHSVSSVFRMGYSASARVLVAAEVPSTDIVVSREVVNHKCNECAKAEGRCKFCPGCGCSLQPVVVEGLSEKIVAYAEREGIDLMTGESIMTILTEQLPFVNVAAKQSGDDRYKDGRWALGTDLVMPQEGVTLEVIQDAVKEVMSLANHMGLTIPVPRVYQIFYESY